MKKILLLTDFSEASHNALAFARSFFSDSVVNFHLLCANSLEPAISPANVAQTTRMNYASQLQHIITELHREATNDWHTYRSSSRPGKPLNVVEQAITEEAYDFVVIGPQPNETNELFGNSAIDLIRQLKANVLVVPGNSEPRLIRRIVLAADFANLKNSKLLEPVKDLVSLKGATLTLLTIDTPNKAVINVEQEAHIRQFLLPIIPNVARLQSPTAKQGIDAFLTANLVDLLVTIPAGNARTELSTSSRNTRSKSFAPAVPLLTLYDDDTNDRPKPVD
ncbi:MAG: universal stress protein [Rudanella sp.]|nr:universal stress protein [Rudanella sp.]